MKQIDIRLKPKETDFLRSLVGKKIESLKHDPFFFTNASSQVVQFDSEAGTFFLYSFTEPLDYFGKIEDVSVWTIETEKYEFVDKKQMLTDPIQEKVNSIMLVQENQRLYQGNELSFDIWLTRGIIIDFGTHQYSFEKAIWFSEDIYIKKGYDLFNGFTSTKRFVDSDWSAGFRAECTRELEILM
ncbi:MAG: hypothetical protein J5757_00445 [Lachnospiraceae bacterium]|nr:hypothetical protein [Lachnospiraceae bacterium]